MHHDKNFMLCLRDLFEEATKRGLFNAADMTNEHPSSWAWEDLIFKRGGQIGNDELEKVFAESASRSKTTRSAHKSVLAGSRRSRSNLSKRGAHGPLEMPDKVLGKSDTQGVPEPPSPSSPSSSTSAADDLTSTSGAIADNGPLKLTAAFQLGISQGNHRLSAAKGATCQDSCCS